MEYYSAIKRNAFETVLMRWINLELIMQSEASQKVKDKHRILTHIYRIQKNGSVQLVSCVRLFATPWTAARQASLSFTVSSSLLKLMLLSW